MATKSKKTTSSVRRTKASQSNSAPKVTTSKSSFPMASAKDRADALSRANAVERQMGTKLTTAAEAESRAASARNYISSRRASGDTTYGGGFLKEDSKAIDYDTLNQKVTAPVIPQAPVPNINDYNSVLNDVPVTTETPTVDTGSSAIYDIIKKYTPKQENLSDQYAKMERKAGIEQKQQLVNQYQGQLNTIVTNAQANQLQTTGQGRGIPEVIIGGQQAQIAKEAAIQALPVQATLSAAQGDLETATARLDKMFTIFQQDAQNEYNYKKNLFDSVLSIATKDQERALMLADKESDRKYQEKQANIALGNQLALQAAERGYGATTLSAIAEAARAEGATSATILRAAGGSARTPVAPTSQTPTVSPYQQERVFRTLQSVDELSLKASNNPGIFGRTAALPLPGFARSGAFRDFRTELDTLKANIAFGELQAMREASKTGGALGSVANQELQLLESTLGGLDMSQSPENFKRQLSKIKTSLQRWNAAQGNINQEVSITAPNGEQIIISN